MKRPYHILFQIFCKATALVGFLHTVDSDRGLSPGDPRHSAVLSAMTATGSPDILAGMAALEDIRLGGPSFNDCLDVCARLVGDDQPESCKRWALPVLRRTIKDIVSRRVGESLL